MRVGDGRHGRLLVCTNSVPASLLSEMKTEHRDDWIAGVRATLAGGGLVEPPDWVLERARALFRSRFARHPARPSSQVLLARVRASLVFDSRRPGVAPAGVRSAGVLEGPWQLLYRGGDVDVDLLIRPNQDGRTLNVRGQAMSLVADSMGVGVVEALPSNLPRRPHGPLATPSARSAVEASGEFALSNLKRGRYDVLLRFGAREIELSGVEF
jgi:hypothetical protein